MFPPFPTEEAQIFCRELMTQFDNYSSLCPQENNPDFSTDCLFGSGKGQMFGVLVCKDSQGRQVVLKAFSGQYNGHFLVPGWVPPLLDTKAYDEQVEGDDKTIKKLSVQIESTQNAIEKAELKMRRKELSRLSLEAIYKLYRFPCWNGRILSFCDILPGFVQGGKFPPTGTGDCCAPKLLGYAFSKNLVPVSLAEFFYGDSNLSGTRLHKEFYPPCDEKCSIVMPFMLGLKILYRDDYIVVVEKPAGLLSVPGRGEDMQDCVVNRLRCLFPNCIKQPSVHRLDMDTSGLLVLAFTEQAHKNLSAQFMQGKVYKEYHAVLRGRLQGSAAFNEKGDFVAQGKIELPFRLDVGNRPKQIYDEIHGKVGITEWFFVKYERCPQNVCKEKVLSHVRFVPRTGRTHQLRLHSMHEKGLGAAIQGDRLYGVRHEGERLMLHASLLEFAHPETNEKLRFSSIPPF